MYNIFNKHKIQNIYKLFMISFVLIAYYSISFPGIINFEGLSSIEEGAKFFSYGKQIENNFHLAFPKYFWGFLHFIFQHISLVWCFNIFLYVIVCFKISQLLKYTSPLCFILLTLWPPIFLCMENMKAETTGITFILLAYCSLFRYINIKKSYLSISIPLFCILAISFRYDDILAIFPLIVFFIIKFTKKNIRNINKLLNYISQLCIICTLSLLIIYIPNSTVRQQSYKDTTFMIWDLIGIHMNADVESFMLGNLEINMKEKSKYYNGNSGDEYWWKNGAGAITPGVSIVDWDESLVNIVRKKWVESIIRYPFEYIKHRLQIINSFFLKRSWYLENDVTRNNGKFNTIIIDQIQLKIPYSKHRYIYENIYWKFRFDRLWIHGIYIISSIIFTLLIYIINRYILYNIDKFQFTLCILLSQLCTSLKVIFIPAVSFRYGLWIPVSSILIFSILLDNIVIYTVKKFYKHINIS